MWPCVSVEKPTILTDCGTVLPACFTLWNIFSSWTSWVQMGIKIFSSTCLVSGVRAEVEFHWYCRRSCVGFLLAMIGPLDKMVVLGITCGSILWQLWLFRVAALSACVLGFLALGRVAPVSASAARINDSFGADMVTGRQFPLIAASPCPIWAL